jgi:hypothetical protein
MSDAAHKIRDLNTESWGQVDLGNVQRIGKPRFRGYWRCDTVTLC